MAVADEVAEAFVKKFGPPVSRRDLFVAAALQGYLASDRVSFNLHDDIEIGNLIDQAIGVADRTLRRLEEIAF